MRFKQHARFFQINNPYNIFLYLVSSLLLFPFFTNYTSEMSHTINIGTFYLFFAVVALVSAVFILLNKRGIKLCLPDVFVLLYVVYLIVNTLILGENILINDELLILISVSIMYFLIRFSYCSKQQGINVAIFCICIGLIVEGYAIVQFYKTSILSTKYLHLTSFFGNPNILTAYLISILPFGFYFLINSNKSKNGNLTLTIKIFSLIFIILCYFIVFITISRIAIFLSIVIPIAMVYPSLHFKIKAKFVNIILGIFFICLVLAFLFVVKNQSTYGRVLIWKISSQIVLDHPINGIGIGRFEAYYNSYQSVYFSIERSIAEKLLAGETFYPFNEFLKILVENGLIGFLIFIGILLACLNNKTIFFNILAIQSPYFVSFASILILGLFGYPLQETAIKINFYIFLAVFVSITNNFTSDKEKKIGSLYRIVIFFCLISLSLLHTWRFIKINEWKKISQGSALSNEDVISTYKNLYPYLRRNSIFLIDYGIRKNSQGDVFGALQKYKEADTYLSCMSTNERIAEAYFKLGNWHMAEQYYLKANYMVPSKFRSKFILFNFYKTTHQRSKYKKIGKEILTMAIKVPSIDVDLIREEVGLELKK